MFFKLTKKNKLIFLIFILFILALLVSVRAQIMPFAAWANHKPPTLNLLAGSAGSYGVVDGVGNNAKFNNPQGVAIDSSGNLYVADSINKTIRKITSSGVVTTLAGTAGVGPLIAQLD